MAVKFLSGIDVDGSMNLHSNDIPNLDASKVTSGTFSTSRIPNLSASKITSGTINAARLPDLSGTYQPAGNYLTSLPSHSHSWSSITSKPSTFTPSAHTHDDRYILTYFGGKNIDEVGTYIAAKDDGGWAGGARMASAHNGYGAITMHLHTGDYYGQIHLSANTEDMGVRFKNGNSTWSGIHTVWTSKHFSASSFATAAQGSKADTAHGWGNHASAGYLTSLPSHSHSWSSITGKPSTFTPSAHNHDSSYDAIGSANAVNDRIDNEVLPLIDTKADASHTHSYLPLSGGTITGSLQVNGTMEVVGNRVGFVNSNFDAEIRVSDENPNGTGAVFNFYGDGISRNATLSAEYFDGVAANSNLLGGSSKASFLTNATVSNDTITFTKGDGSTFSITTSDANTNTWRGIDDVPVNGQTGESISSNWAYDHVNASNPHGTTAADVGALAVGAKAADSNLLDGLDLHTGRNNQANKVVRTNQHGYIDAGWINTTSGNTTSTLTDIYVNTNDGYIRKATPAHFRSQITNGHYDAAGSAASVESNLQPQIDNALGVANTAQTTADNAQGTADTALTRAETALASIPTNNNQLTNGAGYVTSNHNHDSRYSQLGHNHDGQYLGAFGNQTLNGDLFVNGLSSDYLTTGYLNDPQSGAPWLNNNHQGQGWTYIGNPVMMTGIVMKTASGMTPKIETEMGISLLNKTPNEFRVQGGVVHGAGEPLQIAQQFSGDDGMGYNQGDIYLGSGGLYEVSYSVTFRSNYANRSCFGLVGYSPIEGTYIRGSRNVQYFRYNSYGQYTTISGTFYWSAPDAAILQIHTELLSGAASHQTFDSTNTRSNMIYVKQIREN